MGLDQYIKKSTYVNDKMRYQFGQHEDLFVGMKTSRIQTIQEEIAYFCKFNALHRHIVETEETDDDNCRDFYFNPYIRTLKEICEDILKGKNPEVAHALLPAGEGFFFGTLEYDDWYFEDVQHLKDVLDQILAEDPRLEHSYYYYAWY